MLLPVVSCVLWFFVDVISSWIILRFSAREFLFLGGVVMVKIDKKSDRYVSCKGI